MSSYTGLDVNESSVFVSDADSSVWAMDRRSGASLWRQDALQYRNVTRPVVLGPFVVVGDLDGYLHWLSRDTGQIRARSRIASQAIVVPPVSDGQQLFAVDIAGQVAAFRGPW
jgi:outer membrane protein assembly factor BamB